MCGSCSMAKDTQYIKWSDSFSMGIQLIDDQHKYLLDFVNELFNHVTGNEKEERAYFKDVIHTAMQSIKEHFQTEEKLMMVTNFSGYLEHKKAHDDFTMTMTDSIKDFDAGMRLVLEKHASYLKDWVFDHLAVMDTQYAAYFRKIATRKADGKLTITKSDILGMSPSSLEIKVR